MHLVLEVQSEKAVENAVERLAGELRHALRETRVRTRSVEAKDRDVRLVVRDDEAVERLERAAGGGLPDPRSWRVATRRIPASPSPWS